MTPSYSATVGKLWVERGGVYVLANIRGGGEFGPQWHTSATKANKQRSYDDFAAVAEDLAARNTVLLEQSGAIGTAADAGRFFTQGPGAIRPTE